MKHVVMTQPNADTRSFAFVAQEGPSDTQQNKKEKKKRNLPASDAAKYLTLIICLPQMDTMKYVSQTSHSRRHQDLYHLDSGSSLLSTKFAIFSILPLCRLLPPFIPLISWFTVRLDSIRGRGGLQVGADGA
jgi:hypothetical protein